MNINRKRTIGQILIDLTPLLDVVFILLMIVMIGSEMYTGQADREKAEAADIKAEYMAQEAVLKDSIDTYEHMSDYVGVITIYAGYQPSYRQNRTVYIGYGSETKTIALNGANTSKAWKDCKNYISGLIEAGNGMPFVISILDEQMLYRDEQSIEEIYVDLCTSYSNLYLKNYTETEDE